MNKIINNLKDQIQTSPGNASNYFNLGNEYNKINNKDLALEMYEKAVEIKKDFYECYNNIGAIYRDKKNYKKSFLNFQKSIKINPNYTKALYNIAITLYELKEYEKSLNFFKHVLRINPKDQNSCSNIAKILIKKNLINEAILYYKKNIDHHPEIFLNYENLLVLYENSNLIKDYEFFLNLCKKKFPKEEKLFLYYGILNFRKKNYLEAITLLNENDYKAYNLEYKKNLYLGRSYDHLNKTNEAFDCFIKANQLYSLDIKVTTDQKKSFLENIFIRKKFFTKKNLVKWKYNDYKKFNYNLVFFVGFPRSGTTLLETILRSHSKIKIIDEKPMVSNMIKKIINNDFTILENITEEKINEFRNEYIKEFEKYENFNNENYIYIDKLPLNMIHAAEIHRIFPQAKFIHLMRHPLDTVLSCFMQIYENGESMINFLDLKETGNIYKHTMDLWDQYHNNLKINCFTIKYEDLIYSLENKLKAIIKFLEINWEKNLLNYTNTGKKRGVIPTPSYYQVIQPIYTTSNNRWKRYKNHLIESEKFLKSKIKEYEY